MTRAQHLENALRKLRWVLDQPDWSVDLNAKEARELLRVIDAKRKARKR